MADTVLLNPMTADEVTLLAPLPHAPHDALVFVTRLVAGAAGSPPHRHAHLIETFEGLDGVVTVRLGKTDVLLGRGDIVTVRPNTIHAFRNVSDRPALLKCTVTPGARFERFLRGMQSDAEKGRTNAAGIPRDPRRLARLLLDADFHFPRVPMGLQRRLFGVLAAFSPV